MRKDIIFIVLGALIGLLALTLIGLVTYYAIIQDINVVYYFLIIPTVILIIGFLILRHGLRLKKKS